MRKKRAWLGWLLVPMLCTGCQLMPEEEELKTAPVIRSYEAEEYTQTIVMRGDLILSKKVDCTYVAARQEELGFELGGVYIDKIYVSEGQQVQAGELLAELEYDNLKEEISSKQHDLNVLNVRKTYILENRDLELEALNTILSEEDEQEQQKQRESIEQLYEAQLQEVEDSLYIEQLRLDEMQEELKQRQIYAGIDGTVIHVKASEEGERSVSGECVITVADLDTNVFTVGGEDAQYFPVGTQVTVVCGDKEYEAAAVCAEELGIEEQQGEEAAAYLRLSQVDPTLEDGKKGSIELVLDQRSDVLYVDKNAVKTANGEQLVYTLDENGLRTMKTVVIGLVNDKYAEVISGLTEGESVITE